MIMKASKLALPLLIAGLTVGCASTSEMDTFRGDLQSQIDELRNEVASSNATAEEALETARDARSKAASAESAALRAASAAEEANSKLDRMFKRSMMK